MTRLSQATNQNLAKTIIWRVGYQVTIERPDGSETINIYGKKDDTDITYTSVSSDEYAYPIEPSGRNEERRATAEGGRVTQHAPEWALAYDTDAQEDDKLTINGTEYHVINLRDRDAYYAAVVMNINQ